MKSKMAAHYRSTYIPHNQVKWVIIEKLFDLNNKVSIPTKLRLTGIKRISRLFRSRVYLEFKMAAHSNHVNSSYQTLLSQLGPKPTRPKPCRPKTNSAQNQVGPKPTRPKTHSALDYEILLLLSSSLSPFLFSSSSIVCIMHCHWEFILLKGGQSKKFGNLERCNFQTVTVM